MAWRLAESLDQLRDQIDVAAPYRSKVSDGTIGDATHATTDSDHNPHVKDGPMGVVTAIDITNDPAKGCDAAKIVNLLIASRDPRIKYLIWNHGIWRSYNRPGVPAWTRSPYTGVNAHDHHFHLSVQPSKVLYDSRDVWAISPPRKPKVRFELRRAGKTLAASKAIMPGPSRERVRLRLFLLRRVGLLVRELPKGGITIRRHDDL